jgi:isocitrate dehydrogenase
VQVIDAVGSKIPQGKLNGWIIALKNYDGDVVSDQVAGEHKSLGLMDSTLVSADGTLLADPPHGTAPDLEAAFHEKGILLANPAAHIFAYAEAIRHKAELNGQAEGIELAKKLKLAVVATIEEGLNSSTLTGDLAKDKSKSISGQKFIANVRDKFAQMIAKPSAKAARA